MIKFELLESIDKERCKVKDKHNIGDDISDYMRESLQDIEGIYNKIINHGYVLK